MGTHETENIKIHMRRTVRPNPIFLAKPGTILRYGEIYSAIANKHGAVIGICENGETLGVAPGEFEFLELPQWLADIWSREESWCVNGAKIHEEDRPCTSTK